MDMILITTVFFNKNIAYVCIIKKEREILSFFIFRFRNFTHTINVMTKLTGGIINACIFFEILYYFFIKKFFENLVFHLRQDY